ncbi:MAG: CsbD family protein [Mycolicibacterium neoaurum]|uniref:CsbD family protein n=1 Tax=Mycolicibacterium neoaurum TaxID=1795 RepID=UPI002FFC37D5
MTARDASGQARRGLIDSVKGKAKELAGAVTGNDSLTAEGQLEQEQARQRKEANTVETVANAEAETASRREREAHRQAAEQRDSVRHVTAAVDESITGQQAAQTQAGVEAARREGARQQVRAGQEARLEIGRAEAQERVDARAAAADAADALAAHAAQVEEADRRAAEADELRSRAEKLTDRTDNR